MKKIGDTLNVFFIVGHDDLLHVTSLDVRAGDEFFAACSTADKHPRAARAPRMKSDGVTFDERPCPRCILQPS